MLRVQSHANFSVYTRIRSTHRERFKVRQPILKVTLIWSSRRNSREVGKHRRNLFVRFTSNSEINAYTDVMFWMLGNAFLRRVCLFILKAVRCEFYIERGWVESFRQACDCLNTPSRGFLMRGSCILKPFPSPICTWATKPTAHLDSFLLCRIETNFNGCTSWRLFFLVICLLRIRWANGVLQVSAVQYSWCLESKMVLIARKSSAQIPCCNNLGHQEVQTFQRTTRAALSVSVDSLNIRSIPTITRYLLEESLRY